MARHPGLPKPKTKVLNKSDLLEALLLIDKDQESTQRILQLETGFRNRMTSHVNALPAKNSTFQKFNTSPFVLMIHCLKRGYCTIKNLENDILPAKEFSSMETSAGRMVEEVVLPVYGWETVASAMHTANSALDGKRLEDDTIKLATLKSGPRCLNDEMSENFADAIINNAETWANDHGVKKIDFTYGVLYGTQKQSNKKDWHILRNICEKLPATQVTQAPDGKWGCSFVKNDINVNVTIRIGMDWWEYLGTEQCFMELCVSLIRACVKPAEASQVDRDYTISDLARIVSTDEVPDDFNALALQRSQLKWLFFFARHFCDEIT